MLTSQFLGGQQYIPVEPGPVGFDAAEKNTLLDVLQPSPTTRTVPLEYNKTRFPFVSYCMFVMQFFDILLIKSNSNCKKTKNESLTIDAVKKV